MPKKSIAFFDFDGTVTTADTMLELAKFFKGGLSYYWRMGTIFPVLTQLKFHLVSATEAKEKFLTRFFGGMHQKSFEALCHKFCQSKFDQLMRQQAVEKIIWHKQQQHEVVIVSASAENWLQPFCTRLQLPYLCTHLEVQDQCITGRLSGTNCNGEEKAIRIRQAFNLTNYEDIYAYGDSSGDLAMLELANQKFFRRF